MRNQPKYSLFKNALYAFDGVLTTFKTETSFKLEMFFGFFLGIAILWLPISFYAKMTLSVTLILIMIIELLNSAIENVVDLASKEIHPLAKNAKDMGAAAVLFSVLLHVGCWVAVILKELL